MICSSSNRVNRAARAAGRNSLAKIMRAGVDHAAMLALRDAIELRRANDVADAGATRAEHRTRPSRSAQEAV